MSDDGFTLVDAVAALLIIGLAVGGVTEAVKVMASDIRHLQTGELRVDEMARARRAFVSMPSNLGPFTFDQAEPPPIFEGMAKDVRLDCGFPAPCEMHIREGDGGVQFETVVGGETHTTKLNGSADLSFAFVTSQGDAQASWPGSAKSGRLAAIILNDRQSPIAVLPLINTAPARCAFDIGQGRCVGAST